MSGARGGVEEGRERKSCIGMDCGMEDGKTMREKNWGNRK